jgi:hypothetical protein
MGVIASSCLAAFAIAGCANSAPVGETGTGGTSTTGEGGSTGAGDTGGTSAEGGSVGTGGTLGTGSAGTPGAGGTSSGGTTGAAGATGAAGTTGAGRGGTTGVAGTTGAGRGGTTGAAGTTGAGRGGTTGTAGATGTAGTTGTGGSSVNCSGTLPTGGVQHTSMNASGTAAGLNWTIWSNGAAGSITTYDTPAFRAVWNNSGDYLARLGLQWNATKTYDQYGTIDAQFAFTRTGTGGGYSYIGVYGWSVSPCIEFYIVDDSYNKLPVNPGNTTNKGTATIDGGTYTLYTRATTGTGGSKCPGVSSWTQFYSIRQAARSCGQISITEHFKAWAAAGMTLGKMDQAQLLVEVGGGSGSIDFTTATVTAQ